MGEYQKTQSKKRERVKRQIALGRQREMLMKAEDARHDAALKVKAQKKKLKEMHETNRKMSRGY